MISGMRHPIRFDPAYRLLSTALFLLPSESYLEVTGDEVHVRMGWGFRTHFARSALSRIEPLSRFVLSRGVHGFGGRWLVNGSGDGLLRLLFLPAQRGYVVGVPVRLKELTVSFEHPRAVLLALEAR